MALQTVQNFPGIVNQTRDISPLANALEIALTGQRQTKETLRLEGIERDRQTLRNFGAQALRIRKLSEGKVKPEERIKAFQNQKREVALMAQMAQERGEDIAPFQRLLAVETPDQLNTLLVQLSTRAAAADEKVGAELFKQGLGVGATKGGLASAKTEILEDGSTIQVLPDETVQVTNPSGQRVEGQERLDTLKRSQNFRAGRLKEESDIAVTQAQGVANAKQRAVRVSDITREMSARGRDAARTNIKLRSAETLIGKAEQGLTGSILLQSAKIFPGIDVTNEGALQGAFTDLALDALQRLKGPSTDFEFIKMESIGGAIGDAKTANRARIKSLQRNAFFAGKESEQFRNHVNAGGNPDEFNFNFGESVKTKKGIFTLRDIQDTALDKNLSIEETIELLNR